MKYLLLLCYFISAILALLFSTEFYKSVINRTENRFSEEKSIQNDEIKEFLGTMNLYVHSTLMFGYIAMAVLPIAFVALYILQNITFHNLFLEDIFNSGIHIPFILLLSGYIIRGCFQKIAKEQESLSSSMMKKVIMNMAITCNIALLPIDLTFALFVLALILGKYIWIDFVYDEISIRAFVAKIIRNLKQKEASTNLCIFYASFFLLSFYCAVGIYGLCNFYQFDIGCTRNWIILYLFAETVITICFIRILRCVRKY